MWRFGIITGLLVIFFLLQSVLIIDAKIAIANYQEPILAWSTHSAVANTNSGA
ncbi:MAG: hypothetical protein H3C43_06285 [Leptonema sp. (in: Bacteria)]|nr:hypothetical protein [Leptonema sp. (in: bacteria)]